LKINDTASKIQIADSICTCKSCNHAIKLDCLDANCTCCRETDHSMVLDGHGRTFFGRIWSDLKMITRVTDLNDADGLCNIIW